MLTISISPILAFIAELVRHKFGLKRIPFFIILGLLTLPSIFIWTQGYSFISETLQDISIISILTLIFFIGFTILNLKDILKLAMAIVLTLVIFGLTLLGSIGGEFGGGKREVINKNKFMNYTAYELGPKLYEKENTLQIVKTNFFNLTQKEIFETTYSDTLSNSNCDIIFFDNKTELNYNFCKHKLSPK